MKLFTEQNAQQQACNFLDWFCLKDAEVMELLSIAPPSDATNFIYENWDEKHGVKPMLGNGLQLIAEERQEQIEKHGFDVQVDKEYYSKGELVQAALYCLTLDEKYYPENWQGWFRDKIKAKYERMPAIEFQIEMSRIAGAFCAANIDNLMI